MLSAANGNCSRFMASPPVQVKETMSAPVAADSSASRTRGSKRLRLQTTTGVVIDCSTEIQKLKGTRSTRRPQRNEPPSAGATTSSAEVAAPPDKSSADLADNPFLRFRRQGSTSTTKSNRDAELATSTRTTTTTTQHSADLATPPHGSDDVADVGGGATFRSLPQSYFNEDALVLAPRLLGKLLRHGNVVLRITEVEAYRPGDTACHGRFNTPRTKPLFGPAGHAYVYRCRFHNLVNVVADAEGVGAAVLIRAAEPISGLDIIQERRGMVTDKPTLLDGPGKVGQALAVTPEWSHHCLYTPGGLEVLDAPLPSAILAGPRVGIDYASPEDVAAPWRFAIAGTKWISNPRNTLKLL